MSRIDFYRVAEDGSEALATAICLVTGKAYQTGHRVHILTADPDWRSDLDQRLWTYRSQAFIPHARTEEADPDDPEPVLLGTDCHPSVEADVLVCATPPETTCVAAFPRVVELVTPDTTIRQAARERYQAYRAAGHELHTHDIRVN